MEHNRIPLSGGGFARIDLEDFEMLNAFTWRKNRIGRMDYAYAYIGGGRKHPRQCSMHRLVMGARKGQMLDHKNRNGLDNRKSNLRFTNKKGNEGNSRPRLNKRSSKFKGVQFHAQNKNWLAQLRKNGIATHLGVFKTARQAALAYDRAARVYFGEFAYLNFPEILDYSGIPYPRRYEPRGSGDPYLRFRQKNRERLNREARESRARKKRGHK